MRPLRRRCSAPRAKRIRLAEPYLVAGAEEARRLGHNYVGAEHVLLRLTRDPTSGATRVLEQLGVTHRAVEESVSNWSVATPPPRIDPDALAARGIDLDRVRERLEQTFGAGALAQTGTGCIGVAPQLKSALAYAVDHAGQERVRDEHVLLGMLSARDSLAANILCQLGVSLEAAAAIVRSGSEET